MRKIPAALLDDYRTNRQLRLNLAPDTYDGGATGSREAT